MLSPAAAQFQRSVLTYDEDMKMFIVALLVVSVQMSSCGGAKTNPELGRVTRIEVRTNDRENIKTIVEPNQILRIVAFVDSQRSGWGGDGDMFGVPIPRVILDFYEGETFKGHFGVGKGFFETQRVGDFASKSISEEEEQEFLSLVGISDELLQR